MSDNKPKTKKSAEIVGNQPAFDCPEFDRVRNRNPIIWKIMQMGGTAEDCAVALAENNDRLIARVMELEGIVPRRVKLPDGRVMIWRCPERLIPEMDISNSTLSGERADK